MQIKRDLVDMALAEANLVDGEDGVNVRDDYSGRGMFGDTCFGVDFDRTGDSIKFMMALGFAMADQAVNEGADKGWAQEVALNLADMATEDSMGRGFILYFPGVTLTD